MGVENSKADHLNMIRLAVFIGRLLLWEDSGRNMLPADDWGDIALFFYPPPQKNCTVLIVQFF